MSATAESRRPWLLAAAGVALLVTLWALRGIGILVAFALLLAYALDPLVGAVERAPLPGRRRVPRGAAAGLVILVLVALLVWLAVFGVPRLTAELAVFLHRLPANVQTLAANTRVWAAAQGLSDFVDPIVEGLKGNAASAAPQIGSILLGWLGRAFGGLVQMLSLAVLPVLTFYLLAERQAVQSSLLRFVPAELHGRFAQVGEAVDRALQSYVRGQVLVCLTMAMATAAALGALGVPNALLLGALAGVAEVIPFVGFTVAAVAIALAGYGASPLHAVLGLVAYAVINNLLGLFVTPRVMSRHLKMHPFVVTVSVLAGAELLGPAGVMLALPGAAVVQALIQEFAAPPPSRRSHV